MAFSRLHLELFLRESRTRPFSGSLLTLGRQDVRFDMPTLRSAARALGVELDESVPVELSAKPELARKQLISDRTLFRSMGFAEVRSLDFSAYEGADTNVDLNDSEIPAELRARFDVIFNGGTIEHVFNVPNALRNGHEMLRPGGRIIHSAPVSNAIDHGFYCLQPTLFLEYYLANRYQILAANVVRFRCRPGKARSARDWTIFEYSPTRFRVFGLGGLDDAYYMFLCVVGKTEASTSDQIPQQGSYVTKWNAGGELPSGVTLSGTRRAGILRRAARWLRFLYAR